VFQIVNLKFGALAKDHLHLRPIPLLHEIVEDVLLLK
jgi:hypothetical protein